MNDTDAAAARLALELSEPILTKAAEFRRIVQQKTTPALVKQTVLIPYLCVHLACETRQISFPAVQCVKLLQTTGSKYNTALGRIRQILKLPPPVLNLHSLAVRLGATQLVGTAEELLAVFIARYQEEMTDQRRSNFDDKNHNLLAAVFYVCGKTMMKIAKKDVECLVENCTMFKTYTTLVEHYCKDEIHALKRTGAQQIQRNAAPYACENAIVNGEEAGEALASKRSASDLGNRRAGASGPAKRARMGASSSIPLAPVTGNGIANESVLASAVSGINAMVM
ncbi:hypothetical protein HKX48_002904 [Thoreauomyces humboldtii]|nr:hypothetical protein HKX48_002904 [Thoreauomyces humboldtii]